jgi:hypothetical protein
MTETKTNPVFRVMPSLTDVAFVLPLALLFAGLNGVRTMLTDGDTGWHIRTGEWILAHRQAPHQDIFSFTKSGEAWFAWEWLWDVCAAWVHRYAGLGGVVLASLLVICLTSALLYRLALRVTISEGRENPLVAAGLAALAMAGASVHWLARPHLFTMLFLVVFLTILEKARGVDLKKGVSPRETAAALWPLPLLTLLWTNLHGGFLIGIVVVALYGVGPLLGAAIETDGAKRAALARSSVKYLVAAAACALASLANPYGYHLHQHIYAYLRDPFAMQYIVEFQGTNFRWGAAPFLEIMLGLGAGAAIWHGLRRRFTEVLALVGFAHLSLVVARNIPIFMILAAPLVARPLVHWLRALAEAPVAGWLHSAFTNFEEIGMELAPLERPWRVHALSAAAILLLGAAMYAPGAGLKLKPEYDPKTFPAGALAALDTPGQRIFTNDVWGDYLVYRLYPRGGRVYIDGRSDFYGAKFGEETLNVLNVNYDWEKTLARYGVDTILLPADAPLAGAIKESRHWRVRYDDGLALVFRPADGAPGTNPQVSAGAAGGFGGRDLPVTAAATRESSGSRILKKEGVNP